MKKEDLKKLPENLIFKIGNNFLWTIATYSVFEKVGESSIFKAHFYDPEAKEIATKHSVPHQDLPLQLEIEAKENQIYVKKMKSLEENSNSLKERSLTNYEIEHFGKYIIEFQNIQQIIESSLESFPLVLIKTILDYVTYDICPKLIGKISFEKESSYTFPMVKSPDPSFPGFEFFERIKPGDICRINDTDFYRNSSQQMIFFQNRKSEEKGVVHYHNPREDVNLLMEGKSIVSWYVGTLVSPLNHDFYWPLTVFSKSRNPIPESGQELIGEEETYLGRMSVTVV